jgi:hypothetical protein
VTTSSSPSLKTSATLRVLGVFVLGVVCNSDGFLPQNAWADPGASCHFHGAKAAAEATILGCAAQRKEKLISQGKIDDSWKSISHETITQVEGKKAKEWRVTYKNPAAQDKSKETLYMFFSLPGNFIAANFTGK